MEPFLKCRCLEYANKLSKVLKNHSFVGIVGTCVLSCFVQKCILYVDKPRFKRTLRRPHPKD